MGHVGVGRADQQEKGGVGGGHHGAGGDVQAQHEQSELRRRPGPRVLGFNLPYWHSQIGYLRRGGLVVALGVVALMVIPRLRPLRPAPVRHVPHPVTVATVAAATPIVVHGLLFPLGFDVASPALGRAVPTGIPMVVAGLVHGLSLASPVIGAVVIAATVAGPAHLDRRTRVSDAGGLRRSSPRGA